VSLKSFAELGLSQKVLKAVEDLGFEQPTPIQMEAIPTALDGQDLVGQAQTGTGKTAAFAIPIVERLQPQAAIQALVMTPTRELAIQVAEEVSKIGKHARINVLPVYGGQSIDRQIKALRRQPHVVIGTPGRLLDHIGRRTIRLDHVHTVVLDEADEMLDMGFLEDIERILAVLPAERQTMLFSATIPDPIMRLSRRFMQQPKVVRVHVHEVTVPLIEQRYYEVNDRKLDALCRLLDAENPDLCLIFCRTKKGVDELARSLLDRGYQAQGLHGDLSQRERENAMYNFRQGNVDILVATDVAGRGLDIEGVSHVINYDIPQDPDSYVHRIGRTGRAGRQGVAMTLVTRREMMQLRTIERAIGKRLRRYPLPSLAEVRQRRQQVIINRIAAIIQENNLGEYRNMAADLLGQYESTDLLAAVMKIAFDEHRAESVQDPVDTGAEEGMVRFFINIGRQDGVGPGDILGAVASGAGISGRLIGRINIYDRFSFVEVPADYSDTVYEAMRGGTIKGKEISMEYARGGSGR